MVVSVDIMSVGICREERKKRKRSRVQLSAVGYSGFTASNSLSNNVIYAVQLAVFAITFVQLVIQVL